MEVHASPKTLSSLLTFSVKFVSPIGWTVTAAYLTFNVFSSPTLDPEHFLFYIAAVTLLSWWYGVRLKRVRMDDRVLYISNYRTEIAIRLSNVADVTEIRWINLCPVTIRFRSKTEFGSQIVFIPTMRLFSFLSHPVVDEIRSAVARATEAGLATLGGQ